MRVIIAGGRVVVGGWKSYGAWEGVVVWGALSGIADRTFHHRPSRGGSTKTLQSKRAETERLKAARDP